MDSNTEQNRVAADCPNERVVMRDFEIGDIVVIGVLDGWYEVVGVIHDEERLFVATGPSWVEQEFPFGSVLAQYRRIDA